MGYKPDEAKKLLADAGFPDGIDVEINCKPDPSWEQAAVEAMAEQWKAGGHPRQDQCAAVEQVLGSVGQGAVRLHRMDPSSARASWCWRLPIAPACRGTSRPIPTSSSTNC